MDWDKLKASCILSGTVVLALLVLLGLGIFSYQLFGSVILTTASVLFVTLASFLYVVME